MSGFFAILDAAIRATQFAQMGNYTKALEVMRTL